MKTDRRLVSTSVSAILAALAGSEAMHAYAADASNAVPAAPPAQTTEQQRIYDFSIAPQSLASALTAFAEQSGLRFAYSADLTRGIDSKGLSGRMTTVDGLRTLLAGTGLTFRTTGVRTITIEKAASETEARTLSPVRVEGVDSTEGRRGANGSTDLTATEGTRSYTTSAVTLGSKSVESLRYVPQSVSVITQQQISDRNLTSLEDVLRDAPGLAFVPSTSGTPNNKFYSRGFELNYSIDGGFRDDIYGDGAFGPIDISQYDHVEILRGPEGLFQGRGEGGGTVNLVRKKPLDHAQVKLEGALGSWDNKRVMLDLTGPTGIHDVKARAVVEYKDQDFFYDTAYQKSISLYGIAEYDPTPDSAIRLGMTYTDYDANPWNGGIPRSESGEVLDLPRSFSTNVPWAYQRAQITEYFGTYEKGFELPAFLNSSWRLQANARHRNSHSAFKELQIKISYTDIERARYAESEIDESGQKTYGLEMNLSGKLEAFDRTHEIVFGAARTWFDNGSNVLHRRGTELGFVIDFFNWDSEAIPEPGLDRYPKDYFIHYSRAQSDSVYLKLSLELLKGLRFLPGVNMSSGENDFKVTYFDPEYQQQYGIDNSGTPFTQHHLQPYFGLTYDMTGWLTTYLNHTDASRNSVRVLDYNLNDLPPVHTYQTEGGVKLELAGGRLNGLLSTYRNIYQGEYVQDQSLPRPPNVPPNVDCCYVGFADRRSIATGFDVELAGALTDTLSISTAYSYGKVKYDWRDSEFMNGRPVRTTTPEQKFSLLVSYAPKNFLPGLRVGGNVAGRSRIYNIDTLYAYDDAGNMIDGSERQIPFEQKAYAVVDVFAEYAASRTWSARLNLGNVTDKVYYEYASLWTNRFGAPRNASLTITGRW